LGATGEQEARSPLSAASWPATKAANKTRAGEKRGLFLPDSVA
jgi:hypothetical protein